MPWNYRICVEEHPRRPALVFTVREVYYDDDGTPNGYTASDRAMVFESVDYRDGDEFDIKEDFSEYLDMLAKAKEKPVLWLGDRFPEIYDPNNINPEENEQAEIN